MLVWTSYLSSGVFPHLSCGILARMKRVHRFEAFGRLTAVRNVGRHPHGGEKWECKCACGSKTFVRHYALLSGHTTSCGCSRRESMRRAGLRNKKHGECSPKRRRPEYSAWCAMRNRCRNPRNRAYSRYGGRGITVDPRWESFERFLADMGTRPSPHHSLERVDNDGPYSPANCIWATRKQQARNRRRMRKVTAFGRTQLVCEWAEEVEIPQVVIGSRLAHGWSPERALTEAYHPL